MHLHPHQDRFSGVKALRPTMKKQGAAHLYPKTLTKAGNAEIPYFPVLIYLRSQDSYCHISQLILFPLFSHPKHPDTSCHDFQEYNLFYFGKKYL